MGKLFLLLPVILISLTACNGGGVVNTSANANSGIYSSNTGSNTGSYTDRADGVADNASPGTSSDISPETNSSAEMALELKDLEVANELGFLTDEEYTVTKELIFKKYGS